MGVGGGFTGNKRLSEGIGSLGWLGIMRGGVEDNKTFHFSPSPFPSFPCKLYFISLP